MLRLSFVFALFLASSAYSQESSPREAESKTETSQSSDQNRTDPQQSPAPFPFWFSAQPAPPIINVITSKHAGEESHCAKPENWKEWGAFAWCRSLEWIDAERVIAVWTVVLGVATCILGIATVKLWRATDRLVEGADKTAERQLRAYIFPGEFYPRNRVDHAGAVIAHEFRIEWKNHGPTAAKRVFLNFDWEVFLDEVADGYEFIDRVAQQTFPVYVAPNSSTSSPPVEIDSRILEAVNAGRIRLYFFGWLRYRDIFDGTPEHITRFCTELCRLDGDPYAQGDMVYHFRPYDRLSPSARFNCIDDECN